MANLFGFIGLGVGAFALLCSVLACALPYWQTYDLADFNIGIWTSCTGDECSDPLDVADDEFTTNLQAVRAMVLLGLIANLGGVVAVVLLLFVMKDMKILGFVGGAVFIAGGVFHLIAMAIYVANIASEFSKNYDYGAAFAFDIVAMVASWAAGAIVVFAAIKGGDSQVSA